jgi:hypothetical protein
MSTSMNRIGLAMIALCAMAALSRPSHAGTITDDFSFSLSGTPVAAGSFSYDSSLQGGTLSYADLSAFNFSIQGGTNYDLNYINTTTFSQYLYFQFDTATTAFVGTNIDGFPTLIAAIAEKFASGFFVADINGGDNAMEDYSNGNIQFYDTISISSAVVPEPSSLVLCGIAGLTGFGYSWRRRKRHAGR